MRTYEECYGRVQEWGVVAEAEVAKLRRKRKRELLTAPWSMRNAGTRGRGSTSGIGPRAECAGIFHHDRLG